MRKASTQTLLKFGVDFLFDINYNKCRTESEVRTISPRTGRPKLENSKDTRIGVRLNSETLRKLDEIASLRKESRSEVVRRGIEREYEDIKK